MFRIAKLRDGGYLVLAGAEFDNGSLSSSYFVFASTKISEALEYIREKLKSAPGGRQ